MKSFINLFLTLFLGVTVAGQAPQSFKYQAVARDGSGNVLANKTVSFRISILGGSTSGSVVFSETHQGKVTNAFGLIDLEIGRGMVTSGTFSTINWGGNTFFLKVELDPAGSTAFQLMGTSQLLSVPYALYAKNAENGFSGSYNDLTNRPSLSAVATSGNYNDLTNKPPLAAIATSGSYNDLSGKPVTDGSETKVSAGTNITVTGSGTTANPYKINAVNSHYPGELYGGGVVFYVDPTGQHGLICSLVDLADFNCAWSNVTTAAIGDNARSSWDGQGNTIAIIGQTGHTASAAKLCDDYTNTDYGTGIFSDWFLPSIDQLFKLYIARYEVNKSLDIDGNSLTIPLLKISYWSSDEGSSQYAFHYDFQTVSSIAIGKYQLNSVRAVRSF